MKMNQSYNRIITSSETAQILGISVSSVRNWVKHGFISFSSQKGESKFFMNDVINLKSRLENGELKRLNSRANKIKSSKTFLPDELFGDISSKKYVEKISSFIKSNKLDIGKSMFLISLNLMNKMGLLMRHNPKEFIENKSVKFRGHQGVYDTILSWKESIEMDNIDDQMLELFEFNIPYEDNILGVIYQSVLVEGEKSKLGSYYTPDSVVKNIVKRICKGKRGKSFLDPCCGTGQFLISVAQEMDNPEEIYGIDIDHVAVNIARINLLLKFPERDFFPRVYCNDSLQNYNDSQLFFNIDSLPKFDIIATNPPWGYHYSNLEKKNLSYYYSDIKSGESFSYFLIKSLNMLKKNGLLCFVLPESILNVDIHSDIRNYILNNCSIRRIELGKKIFKKVFSSTVIMDIKNSPKHENIKVISPERSHVIAQERFLLNKKQIFDVHISNDDEVIIDKIHSGNFTTLKDKTVWGLGIVTGDNGTYIKDKPLNDNYEKIVKGKDLAPFQVGEVTNFIEFIPKKFQQCIPEGIFRSPEKLIYKYISNRLVFASDTTGLVTLNSANIMIPKIENISMQFVEGLFNSRLYNFLFMRKFSSVKVLKGHLESLPIPLGEVDFHDSVVSKVKEIKASGMEEKAENIEKLNALIYEFFKISIGEIEYIDSISPKK